MAAALQVVSFEYEDMQVRSVILGDGQPWFVVADVCDVLNLGNPSDAVRRLDEDEFTLVSIEGKRGRYEVNACSEPGLYRLIFASRKAEAKRFQRWVYHEVLPSIRRTGKYARPTVEEVAAVDPIRLALEGPTWGEKANLLERFRKTDAWYIPAEEVARRCGIYTAARRFARPHGKFIHNLILAQLIDVDEGEILFNPTRFSEAIVPRVAGWLARHGYPTEITFGNTKHRLMILRPDADRGYYEGWEGVR